MAITAACYTHFPANLCGGEVLAESYNIDWISDTIKLMLTTSSYVFSEANKDTHEFKSDITNEVTGTAYTAGGAQVGDTTSRAVFVDTTNNKVQLQAPNVQWVAAVVSGIRIGVVYKDTGTAATSPLIGAIDFGGDQSVNGTTFSVEWTSGVVVEFTLT